MTEQEAVAIATQYIDSHVVPYERFDQAFFVPASAYGGEIPDARDSWVVHFAHCAPEEDQFEEALSSRGPIVVSVDPQTREASAVSLL